MHYRSEQDRLWAMLGLRNLILREAPDKPFPLKQGLGTPGEMYAQDLLQLADKLTQLEVDEIEALLSVLQNYMQDTKWERHFGPCSARELCEFLKSLPQYPAAKQGKTRGNHALP